MVLPPTLRSNLLWGLAALLLPHLSIVLGFALIGQIWSPPARPNNDLVYSIPVVIGFVGLAFCFSEIRFSFRLAKLLTLVSMTAVTVAVGILTQLAAGCIILGQCI